MWMVAYGDCDRAYTCSFVSADGDDRTLNFANETFDARGDVEMLASREPALLSVGLRMSSLDVDSRTARLCCKEMSNPPSWFYSSSCILEDPVIHIVSVGNGHGGYTN